MRIETSVVISRPIEEVWAFLADPFNMPRWRGSRLAVRVTSPGPIGVGSTIQHRISVFGLERRWPLTVTEWEPPHAFAWVGRFPGMPWASERYSLESTAGGTKLVRVHGGEPRGMLKLLLPIVLLFVPYLRGGIEGQNQNLKRVLEAGRG